MAERHEALGGGRGKKKREEVKEQEPTMNADERGWMRIVKNGVGLWDLNHI